MFDKWVFKWLFTLLNDLKSNLFDGKNRVIAPWLLSLLMSNMLEDTRYEVGTLMWYDNYVSSQQIFFKLFQSNLREFWVFHTYVSGRKGKQRRRKTLSPSQKSILSSFWKSQFRWQFNSLAPLSDVTFQPWGHQLISPESHHRHVYFSRRNFPGNRPGFVFQIFLPFTPVRLVSIVDERPRCAAPRTYSWST